MKLHWCRTPEPDFEIVEREIPNPGADSAYSRAGLRHLLQRTSSLKKDPGRAFNIPRAPGHEVAGVIDEVGSGVTGWKKGSASASAGTAARTALACRAAAEISSIAAT